MPAAQLKYPTSHSAKGRHSSKQSHTRSVRCAPLFPSQVATDLARATGFGAAGDSSVKKLNRMLPLTGFSDPLYAEAYVTVHQYDIVMDVTVVNRTTETLQNVCLELATMGDLKLVERPQNYTLGPGAQRSIRANIKARSLFSLIFL